MKRLISYFIKYPVSVNTLLTIISVFGFIAYTKLTASFFPLVESRIINIQLVYPGAAPEELEEGVVPFTCGSQSTPPTGRTHTISSDAR